MGMIETCAVCGGNTGKSRPGDPSFYVNGQGPLCPHCAFRLVRDEEDAKADAIEAAEQEVVEAAEEAVRGCEDVPVRTRLRGAVLALWRAREAKPGPAAAVPMGELL